IGQRERDLLELRAFLLEDSKRLADRPLDARLHALDREVLLWNAEAQSFHARVEVLPKIVVREIFDHRRVVRVLAEDRLAHDRRILDGVGERTDLIERRRERDHAPPRYAAVRRLHADDPGEDRKSTRMNSSHVSISYAVFCLKK